MKRIVKAARNKDEILKRREEYRAEYTSQKEQHDAQMKNYRNAARDILSKIENAVLSELGDLVEPLDIDVSAGFRWGDKVELTVRSNENSVHDKHKALSWTFRVYLKMNGEIFKESNSWSGLNAVTDEQIASLRMSVEALEILNKIDWASVLDKPEPEYAEYVTTQEPRNREREFDRELEMADIEEAIESGGLISGKKNSGRSYRGKIWFVIVGETPKQYKVVEVPSTYIDYLNSDEVEIGTTSNGWVTSTPKSIAKKWTSIRDVIEWAKTSDMAYNITKDKFFDKIERPVQILS